jgi:hypothetical protein
MWTCSRRGFAGYLLAPFLRAFSRQPDGEVVASRVSSRTYRADAVILFLGVVIYKRSGVGGGKASLEVSGDGASLRRTLFFAGGSDPKHAHGLNRLGWIRESVAGPVNTPSEASYFGVMTSSPEDSLEGARKSVGGPSPGLSVFNAVSGRNTCGCSRSFVTQFDYPSASHWNDSGLIGQAQAAFQGDVKWRETRWPKAPDQTPSTFLLQLATLLQQRPRRAVGRYVYCEQEYTMELETAASRDKERLLQVRAKVRNLHTGKESLFRLWMDDSAESLVPVRIEYQPRSFLRLTFEAVPG